MSLGQATGRNRTSLDARRREVFHAAYRPVPGGVQLTLDLQRAGSAAYLGSVRIEVLDAAGRVLHEEEDIVSVYRSLRRRFTIPEVPNAARIRYPPTLLPAASHRFGWAASRVHARPPSRAGRWRPSLTRR